MGCHLGTGIRWLAVVVAAAACATAALADTAATSSTKVRLSNGETYDVALAGDGPAHFANDRIRVQSLGTEIGFRAGEEPAEQRAFVLTVELMATGLFDVTVTTPLDSIASESLLTSGPGRITLRFFRQASHPRLWEEVDRPGVHWIPFHFVFEALPLKERIEFTQWHKLDYEAWHSTLQAWDLVKRSLGAE